MAIYLGWFKKLCPALLLRKRPIFLRYSTIADNDAVTGATMDDIV